MNYLLPTLMLIIKIDIYIYFGTWSLVPFFPGYDAASAYIRTPLPRLLRGEGSPLGWDLW